MFDAIGKAQRLLEDVGPWRFVGLAICLLAMGWAVGPEILSGNSAKASFPAVAQMVLFIVGVVLLLREPHVKEGDNGNANGKLNDRVIAVLGSVTLPERNEEAREQTARLLERLSCTKASEDANGKLTLADAVEALYAFLSIGRDELAPGIYEVRTKIDELVIKGTGHGCEYHALLHYLRGVQGLTYLLERFEASNARESLRLLNPAIAALRNEPQDRRFGLSTMLNAKGICHGILAGDRATTDRDAWKHFSDSIQAFQSQLDAIVSLPVSTAVRYRHSVNDAELHANLYWRWRNVGDEGGRADGVRAMAELVECDPSGSPKDFFTALFRRIRDDLTRAQDIAADRAMKRIKRPAVWLSAVVASVAFAHAYHQDMVSSEFVPSLGPTLIPRFLSNALKSMKNDMEPHDIIKLLTYSPIIVEGLRQSQLPSLAEAKDVFERWVSRLSSLSANQWAGTVSNEE